jgi:hypothetical protein
MLDDAALYTNSFPLPPAVTLLENVAAPVDAIPN